ncbi:glycosyltransferase family 61 protein [Rhizobium sp. NFR03]|uniref:glycosyltransferase family 61 protein n=1 Tax=Rhizobium sp. NFR03 TaxID=1566263 RepID=UPI00147E48F9|nr:glycosyltransferase family 61 protein [Rhizobium sp. NFR03]
MNDARVISRFGAVRIDNRFVESTAFQHPFFLTHNLIEDRGEGYLHASAGDVVSIDRALYVCGGIYDNYYHWLLFLIARINPDFLLGIDTIVTSQPNTEFQRTGLEKLLKKYGLKAVYVRDNVSLHVRELAVAQQFGTAGLDPHPVFMETFRNLKNELVDSTRPASERIYISRSDASDRKLVNEREVEALVSRHGFTVVSLQGRSLQEQACLLHSANIIISPHGAGLTNIGKREFLRTFCS